jgi:hypothetical protein
VSYDNKSFQIKTNEFENGTCIWPFNLTPYKHPGESESTERTGTIRLDVKFAGALGHVVSALIYGEFESELHVDKYRNVSTPY